MRFRETPLAGVLVADLEPHADERGSFTRVWSFDAFEQQGLCTAYPEHSVARNVRRGVLRGLHYQAEPHAETKVIRCVAGTVWDVLVDLRPDSPTHGRWTSFELDGARMQLLYVPPGIAHGYQTLSPVSELHYMISARHEPSASRGIAWNSPQLAIAWPLPDPILSERDRRHPEFAG